MTTADLLRFPPWLAKRHVKCGCGCGKEVGRRSVWDDAPHFANEDCAVIYYQKNDRSKLAVTMRPARGGE